MRAVLRRALAPSILLLAGVAALVYGAIGHTVPVGVEKEREVSVPTYTPDGWGKPPVVKIKKTTEKYLEPLEEPEWVLVRDTAVGGLKRLDNGELKRTYSGKPPALCPT
jgi:hypothetical protein